MRLPTDKAVSVAVIVNELVTNAVKYAYVRSAGGEIRIIANQPAPGTVIIVEDDGWAGRVKARSRAPGAPRHRRNRQRAGRDPLYDAVDRAPGPAHDLDLGRLPDGANWRPEVFALRKAR